MWKKPNQLESLIYKEQQMSSLGFLFASYILELETRETNNPETPAGADRKKKCSKKRRVKGGKQR